MVLKVNLNVKTQQDLPRKKGSAGKEKSSGSTLRITKMCQQSIAKMFLKLVDKHFPCTHQLHKIFNRNTIKISYSCMSNVQQLIKK